MSISWMDTHSPELVVYTLERLRSPFPTAIVLPLT